MTSTKAVAAGIAGNLIVVANWLLTIIPGWMMIPDEPRAAIIALVSGGIGALFVWYAPANRSVTASAPGAPEAQS